MTLLHAQGISIYVFVIRAVHPNRLYGRGMGGPRFGYDEGR